MSTLLPHLGSVSDDCTLIRSMKTDVFNHGPAKLFTNTGSPRFGRPSMGAWVTYGIGSEVGKSAGVRRIALGPARAAGRSPSVGQRIPADDLSRRRVPERVRADSQSVESAGRRPPRARANLWLRSAISIRCGSTRCAIPKLPPALPRTKWLTACRPSAPELMDLTRETKQTLADYGADPHTPSFARNCLLARRLVEKG